MALPTVDWGTSVITVPLSYLTLISGSVYSLDTNQFRLDLKTLEAGTDGMPFLRTHKHNTTVTLSGITYARIFEIINGYTITFEVGNYAVILSGSNNNIIDAMNFNGVTVLGNNSAGLIDASLLQSNVETLLFNEHVHIDVNGGVPGTTGTIGTHGNPVNNLTDALVIAGIKKLSELQIAEDLTVLASHNIDGISIIGSHAIKSEITLTSGCSTSLAQFSNCQLTGVAAGPIIVRESLISDLSGFQGIAFQSAVTGYIRPASSVNASMLLQCYAEAPEVDAELDMADATNGIAIRDWNGPMKVTNLTLDIPVCFDYAAARLTIDTTVSNGRVHITGSGGLVTDNSTGTADIDVTGAMTADQLKDVYKLLGLDISDAITITPAGADSASGDIDVTFTGDGVSTTTMTRQP